MAKGPSVRNDDEYRCPLDNKRTSCACPDCLSWRYERAKDEMARRLLPGQV